MQVNYIEINDFGAADKLEFKSKEIDETLEPNEILVDVHFSGINFADIVTRLGHYRNAPPRPINPGYEISGIVKKVGSKVTKFKVGDSVYSGTRFGGYASAVKLPEWLAIKLPKNMSLEEGAAIPVNFMTAYIALHEFARIRQGDKVLLDCSTGGVGVMAMQMCKDVGAECTGLTSSPAKKEFIESYGARAFTFSEFENNNEDKYDMILNSSGGSSTKSHFNLLKRSGVLCCIGIQSAVHNGKSNLFRVLKTVLSMPKFPLVRLVEDSRLVGGFNAMKFFDDDEWLKTILPKLGKTEFKPYIDHIFDAEKVQEAHQFIEQRKARGKVLLKWQ
jgi:NADPH:quinone reductase-like Zn-dependent oxidoreductase